MPDTQKLVKELESASESIAKSATICSQMSGLFDEAAHTLVIIKMRLEEQVENHKTGGAK